MQPWHESPYPAIGPCGSCASTRSRRTASHTQAQKSSPGRPPARTGGPTCARWPDRTHDPPARARADTRHRPGDLPSAWPPTNGARRLLGRGRAHPPPGWRGSSAPRTRRSTSCRTGRPRAGRRPTPASTLCSRGRDSRRRLSPSGPSRPGCTGRPTPGRSPVGSCWSLCIGWRSARR